MDSNFTTLDWFVLIACFAGTLSIDFYFYRKSRNTEDLAAYSGAYRRFPIDIGVAHWYGVMCYCAYTYLGVVRKYFCTICSFGG